MSFRVFKSARGKVRDFRHGRSRMSDERFLAALKIEGSYQQTMALGVRRAIADVGLVDSQFIHPTDRIHGALRLLPVWDSLDWLSFVLFLEEELNKRLPQSFLIDALQRQAVLQEELNVKNLVHASIDAFSKHDAN